MVRLFCFFTVNQTLLYQIHTHQTAYLTIHKQVCIIAFVSVGSCTWIRIPAIIYSSHVATTVWPMLVSFYLDDFSKFVPPGPSTWEERMTLIAIYMPYFLIPELILLTMLFSDTYKGTAVVVDKANANKSGKKNKHKAH